uniref:Probable pectate lyase F n=1 Tax=Ditylenchus dipsaci TaxID=166011 RepID=A0A915DHI8_9BILA
MFYQVIFLIAFLFTTFEIAHCDFWPAATADIMVNATILINASQLFDCNYTRYIPNPTILGSGNQKERQKAVFQLSDSATLQNCIIGAAAGTDGSADGVHCIGNGCTIINVWFEDVGEDAITFYGLNSSNIKYTVRGGGARNAVDKIFQFDGKGTAYIYDFWADTFARFLRHCGNCANQYERHSVLSNITAYNGTAGQFIAGVNFNYNDSATITGLKLGGASEHQVHACKRFTGVTTGEPVSNGTDADGKYCIYNPADITYL